MRDKIAKATPALEKEETGTEAGGVGASKDALRKEGLELQDRLAVLHKTQQKLGKLELKGAQQKQLDDLVAEIHATEKAAKALVTSAEKENLTSDQIGELSSQIGGMKITVDDLSQRADQFISQ